MPAPTALTALADELRADPGRPLITFYDDSGRVELSVATFDNWVNKIANLLTDELMLDPGARFTVELPTHWQSTVVMVGGWTAGLTLVHDRAAAPVDLRVIDAAALSSVAANPDADQVLVSSMHPLGLRVTDPLPPGWLDFGVEVPPQPDQLLAGPPLTAMAPASVDTTGPTSHEELATRGLEAAAEAGLGRAGRLLTDCNPATPDGVVSTLVGPLMVGASVVLVATADAERRTTVGSQERATCTRWRAGHEP
jgi:uncharacterized protein (TIGR03089 family)